MLDTLLREHGVCTVLTGHGGDALLGSCPGHTPSHLVDLLFSGQPIQAWRALSEWSSKNYDPRSRTFLLRHAVLGPALSHLRGRRFEGDGPLPIPPWRSPDYSRTWSLLGRSRKRVATRDWFPGRQEIWESVWSLALSAGNQRTAGDYTVRRPLLYRPFLEFMYALPGAERFQPRCDRYLQRRALKGILPELVRRRGTKLFGTWAFIEGLARSQEWVDYLCEDPELPSIGVCTPSSWRDAIMQAVVGNTYGDRFFVTAVALEVWLKQLRQWRASPPLTVDIAL